MEPETYTVEIRVGDEKAQAELTLTRTPDWDRRGALLRLTSRLGEWTGLGGDIFSSLRELMAALEEDGGRIAVVGARPNAWASGMQRDMGDGRRVYLLSLPRTEGRPPTAPTLDATPLDEVGTASDQDAFQAEWMPKP